MPSISLKKLWQKSYDCLTMYTSSLTGSSVPGKGYGTRLGTQGRSEKEKLTLKINNFGSIEAIR